MILQCVYCSCTLLCKPQHCNQYGLFLDPFMAEPEMHFNWIFKINQNVELLLTGQNQPTVYGHTASQHVAFYI